MELGDRLLYGQGGGRGDLQQPASSPSRAAALRLRPSQLAEGEQIRDEDHHDHDGDRRRAAPHDGADREREYRGHGEQRPGADDHPCLSEQRNRPHRDAGPGQHGRADGEREGGGDRPATKPTAAITTALAASSRPRRGAAVSETRISPRRYSPVMNIAATTTSGISPKNVPSSARWRDDLRRPPARGRCRRTRRSR